MKTKKLSLNQLLPKINVLNKHNLFRIKGGSDSDATVVNNPLFQAIGHGENPLWDVPQYR